MDAIGILNVIKDMPVPTIVIVVGLLFLILGIVNKFGTLEVSSQQRQLAIFLGLFLLVVGIILGFVAIKNLNKFYGIDAFGNDIKHELKTTEKKCTEECKNNPKCVAIVVSDVVSDTQECWLKSNADNTKSDSSRTLIRIR
ncbi:PAN domain-containing protein [Nostoc sp. NMS8]|uniref:PAN domain-containing protein n=1 Tax=Nostoc sp. NMS8 TaxID=2815392 RepID=UPI0025E1C0EF|nr:PAN domain-containing protein [Nostoc sp. NMS8]MBN3962449.1 hypothetical protein [Nostoc sp. NMS8]